MKRRKQTRKHLKLISVLLVLCLSVAVLFSAPMTVSAEEIDSGHTPESNNATTVEDVAAGIASIEDLYENGYELPVTDTAATSNGKPTPIQRLYSEEPDDLYTQVWLNNDGTRTMKLYDHPVKYVTNDGDIEDISLDVVASTTAVGGYETEAGFAKTVFPSKITDGISLSGNGVSVKLTPVLPNSALAMDGLTANDTVTLVNNQTVSYTYDAKTSLDYKLTYMGFKEDIVVNEYTGQTQYTFMLETNGLTLVNENGSYFLKDETGEIKATLGDIIVFTADERNNTMGELTHTVIKPNNYYFLTIQLDAEWLSDENTAYPIRIDPTVEITSGTGAIEDVTINSNAGSDGSSGSLYVGLRSSAGISRTLMKFPGLNLDNFTSDSIISAVVEIRDLMCESSSMVVDAYAFTGGTWSESTASWSSVNPHSLGLWQDSITVSYSNGATLSPTHRYEIDFTSAMLNWKSGNYNKNMGIILKANSPNIEYGSTYIHKTFASYNRSSHKPSLAITYRDVNNPQPATGFLDHVTSTIIKGWAWRRDIPNTSINVKIEITNSTTGQQYEPIIVLANIYRADVQQAGYGNGYHGYQINIDWGAYTPGTYTVRAYGQNSNGTFNELDCSPKTYTVAGYGQPLSDGEYYINNKEHGRYLHNTSSTINVASGTLNNLGSTIKWTLQKYNDGYLIINNTIGKYLAVPSENRQSSIVLAVSTSNSISSAYIWDIVLSDTDGCILRSRHNGRYLYPSTGSLSTSTSINDTSIAERTAYVWRIISTSVYGNNSSYEKREFYGAGDVADRELIVGTTDYPLIDKLPNVIWADITDFTIDGCDLEHCNVNAQTGLITAKSIGVEQNLTITHKITNKKYTFSVFVYNDTLQSGGNLSHWNSVSDSVGFWIERPKVYIDCGNLDSEDSTTFKTSVAHAMSTWNLTSLPISFYSVTDIDSANLVIRAVSNTYCDDNIDFSKEPSTLAATLVGKGTTTVHNYHLYNNKKKFVHKIDDAEILVPFDYSELVDNNINQQTYQTILCHELGHALGYNGHSLYESHLMYKYSNGINQLSNDEINHLKQIYDLYYTGD